MKNSRKNQDTLRTVDALFRNYFNKNKGLIEIRFINKKTNNTRSEFYQFGGIGEEDLKFIQEMNEHHNVYFGVNPRPLNKRKKQDDIKNIICLWADLDGKDFQEGKIQAKQVINNFEISPNIIVDSGNGYHAYWTFKEPIVDIDRAKREEIKQVLSGLYKHLNADPRVLNPDRVMRLPGTNNIKKDDPLPCKIISIHTDQLYDLSDFKKFQDRTFKESDLDIENMPELGKKELIVRNDTSEHAEEDVKELEISSKHIRRILTGSLKTEGDKSRSGRDQSIIAALILSGYNYPTIRGIFFNQYLGCSDRVVEKGEDSLKWDVLRAQKFIEARKPQLSKEQKIVQDIKLSKLKADQKRFAINDFIVKDLLIGNNPVGNGYKNDELKVFYFFHSTEKLLMDIEGIDFNCFLRDRYGIAENEKRERIAAIRTEMWKSGQDIEANKLAFFDRTNYVLYISDHNNGVYKIDGKKIEFVDNGTDGVFFEFNPDFTPFNIDLKNLKGLNYFNRGKTNRTRKKLERILKIEIPEGSVKIEKLGFSWLKFLEKDCFLREFLIDRTHFDYEESKGLTVDEQKFLLVIYFYSLFFESILVDKPIVCFIGKKASGKSFVATSIGRILFGENFYSCHYPKDLDNLRTVLGDNYYLAFDNMDSFIKHEILDDLCTTATGGKVKRRKKYKDREIIEFTPHVFLIVTTREAKFRRDDFVSRLLLFNTKKIDRPKSKSLLFDDIRINRDKIMTEVLINLNLIVELLKSKHHYRPDCISRIADWEVFGRKVAVGFPWGHWFRELTQQMNEEKEMFSLEEDYLFILLSKIIYDDDENIEKKTAYELYSNLCKTAEELKIEKDFQRKYKSHIALGKRIANMKEELERLFKVEIEPGRKTTYSIGPIVELNEENVVEFSEWNERDQIDEIKRNVARKQTEYSE